MKGWLIAVLMALLMMGLIGCGASTQQDQTPASTGNQAQPVTTSKQEADPTEVTWNTKDLSIMTNGNIARAVKLVKAGNLQTVTAAEPAAVAKTPWNYYGKVVEFTGVAEVVDDYPPDSDISKLMGGGGASEVVFVTDDGTIADFFLVGSSGDLRVGDTVTLRGYPVGREEVPNKLGGSFTHLILVGKY